MWPLRDGARSDGRSHARPRKPEDPVGIVERAAPWGADWIEVWVSPYQGESRMNLSRDSSFLAARKLVTQCGLSGLRRPDDDFMREAAYHADDLPTVIKICRTSVEGDR